MPVTILFRSTLLRRSTLSHATTHSHLRTFTKFPRHAYPRKDSQDKDSINTEATEYSKSGSDDKAARQEDAAFDPKNTDPDDQRETAGKGREDKSNPLDVSPANQEVSKTRGATEGGAETSASTAKGTNDRRGPSGGGSPQKGKKVG